MDLSRPLSDDEFRELDAFLRSEDLPDACMDLSALDGFLTAIAIGPAPVAPAQWLPEVWGETAGQAMPWESGRQAERITGLVLRHLNDILWQLTEDPEHYEPVLCEIEREGSGEMQMVIDDWCAGFIHGTLLDEPGWEPLFESEELAGTVLPIVLYGTESGWAELEQDAELSARHDEFARALPASVLAIRDYWLPARKARSTIRHAQPVPGRNDPCPCGSGKKFKKCCGNPTGRS